MTGNTFYFGWEVSLMETLQKVLGPSAISVVSFFSLFGEEMFMIVVIGALYWSCNKKMGKAIGLNILMVSVWASMIKNVFMRRRPYFDHEGITVRLLVDRTADSMDIETQGFSFPSIHSANIMTMIGSLAQQIGKNWMTVLVVVMPLLVGFSRVVVGVHYPTDVLAGWAMGLFTIFTVNALSKVIKSKPLFYGLLILTGLPGLFYCRSTDYFTAYGLLVGFTAGVLFEEKKVNFEETRSPLPFVLRVVGGIAVYIVLNKLMKLPFSSEFLDSKIMASMLVRMCRYAVIAFIDFGVYPMLFRLEKKFAKA